MKELKNIKNILFDLDGVLYQDLESVFGQVSKKMTEYISKKLDLDLNLIFLKYILSFVYLPDQIQTLSLGTRHHLNQREYFLYF